MGVEPSMVEEQTCQAHQVPSSRRSSVFVLCFLKILGQDVCADYLYRSLADVVYGYCL